MCYWKERQCSHLMDPGCHRPASASLRTSAVDHNPGGRCVPTSVIGFEHGSLQVMGTWKGGRLSVYELSFTECASATLWAAILPDLSPPQHKHPKRQLDITLFQEKERETLDLFRHLHLMETWSEERWCPFLPYVLR